MLWLLLLKPLLTLTGLELTGRRRPPLDLRSGAEFLRWSDGRRVTAGGVSRWWDESISPFSCSLRVGLTGTAGATRDLSICGSNGTLGWLAMASDDDLNPDADDWDLVALMAAGLGRLPLSKAAIRFLTLVLLGLLSTAKDASRGGPSSPFR